MQTRLISIALSVTTLLAAGGCDDDEDATAAPSDAGTQDASDNNDGAVDNPDADMVMDGNTEPPPVDQCEAFVADATATGEGFSCTFVSAGGFPGCNHYFGWSEEDAREDCDNSDTDGVGCFKINEYCARGAAVCAVLGDDNALYSFAEALPEGICLGPIGGDALCLEPADGWPASATDYEAACALPSAGDSDGGVDAG